MTRYFLGGDLGGTKSHLLIADETGRSMGFAAGGIANHEVVGYPAVTGVVRKMFAAALASAGLRADIAGAGLGIAGFDWPSERTAQLSALAAAGLQGFPVEVVNDAVVGLLAGSREGWGSVSFRGRAVIAGGSTGISDTDVSWAWLSRRGVRRRGSPGGARDLGGRQGGDRARTRH